MLSTRNLPNHLEGEKIVKILRKDLFVLFRKVVFFLFLVIMPLIFFYILINFIYPDLMYNEIAYPIVVLVLSFYYLFAWLFFFFSFIDYYLDVWIITNERIIDISQNGFFSRTISEQRLSKVQDVTSEVKGFWSTVFGFGFIYVQTAAEKERFIFEEVPNPEVVRNLIIELSEKSRHEHTLTPTLSREERE